MIAQMKFGPSALPGNPKALPLGETYARLLVPFWAGDSISQNFHKVQRYFSAAVFPYPLHCAGFRLHCAQYAASLAKTRTTTPFRMRCPGLSGEVIR